MAGADAPGVFVVLVVVLLGVTGVIVPVVVEVVDGEEPVVDGDVPPDPDALGLVVVVVVLHAPSRRASGPQVEAVASVRSNDAFWAVMVDE
jgi:hypothetical protein